MIETFVDLGLMNDEVLWWESWRGMVKQRGRATEANWRGSSMTEGGDKKRKEKGEKMGGSELSFLGTLMHGLIERP